MMCSLSDAVVPAQFFRPDLRQECCTSGFVFISMKCSLSRPNHVSFSSDFGDMPWFPRKISDLDKAQRVLMYGSELDADHPVSVAA